jgi:hypothetical protein
VSDGRRARSFGPYGPYRNRWATIFIFAYSLALIVALFSVRFVGTHPWDSVAYFMAVAGWILCARVLTKPRS